MHNRRYVRLRIMRGRRCAEPLQRRRIVVRQRWHGKCLALDWVRAVHNHKLVRNCINWSDGRNRKDLRLGGFRDLSVLSFIARSAST
jgi:hypothetical protein